MSSDADLLSWGEGQLMAWVATASLDELRHAQQLGLNVIVKGAIQDRVHYLEGERTEQRHFRIVLAVAVATLIVATVTLVATVLVR